MLVIGLSLRLPAFEPLKILEGNCDKQHWEDEEKGRKWKKTKQKQKQKKTALGRSVPTIFVWDYSFDGYTGYLYLLIGVLSST